METRSNELEKIKQKFENAGLYLDEIEWDDQERLKYHSMSLEDWADSYISQHRPRGLTPEVAKADLKSKHKENAMLKKELSIQQAKNYIASFASSCAIGSLVESQNIMHVTSLSRIIGEFFVVLAYGLLGLVIATLLSSIWYKIVKNRMTLKYSLIPAFLIIPMITILVSLFFVIG